MKKIFLFGVLSLFAVGCGSDDATSPNVDPPVVADEFIRAADISTLPEIEGEGTVFYNDGAAQDAVTTLKNAGVNYVRLRLWHAPATGHSGLQEVKTLAQRVRNAGMKVWLTVHYSDSWADPGQQTKPAAWNALDFAGLKAAAETYTSQILTEINPDIIQIGNETNDGLLWPEGKLSTNENQSIELFQAISQKIRSQSPDTEIMLHFAGITGAEWFFNKTASVDYDYIGLSYYPVWHGTSLASLSNIIDTLGAAHGKKVVLAETAYPFTLGWADYTNNIVGEQGQLVPGFAASEAGQKGFMTSIRSILEASQYGQGFAYWGGEWIAFRGAEATNGSAFENQALWDFNRNALPVMDVFGVDQD